MSYINWVSFVLNDNVEVYCGEATSYIHLVSAMSLYKLHSSLQTWDGPSISGFHTSATADVLQQGKQNEICYVINKHGPGEQNTAVEKQVQLVTGLLVPTHGDNKPQCLTFGASWLYYPAVSCSCALILYFLSTWSVLQPSTHFQCWRGDWNIYCDDLCHLFQTYKSTSGSQMLREYCIAM